jgi:hypothetical protein
MTPQDLERWKKDKFTQFFFEWIKINKTNLTNGLLHQVVTNGNSELIKLVGGKVQQLEIIYNISPEILGLEEEEKDDK